VLDFGLVHNLAEVMGLALRHAFQLGANERGEGRLVAGAANGQKGKDGMVRVAPRAHIDFDQLIGQGVHGAAVKEPILNEPETEKQRNERIHRCNPKNGMGKPVTNLVLDADVNVGMAGGLLDDDDEGGATAVEHVDGRDDVETLVVEDAYAKGAKLGFNARRVDLGFGTEKDDGFLAGEQVG